MQLIPESIATRKITALDETWESRLALLRYSQLKIDFQNEPNIEKLKMWLEMFGGTVDQTVIDTFTLDEYRRLLQSIILLFKLSGTVKSVELIGYVLGVPVQVEKGYVLRYDGTVNYNGSFTYDGGADYSNFIITIRCNAYPADLNIELFKTKFLLLFQIFNPIWIYIMSFNFPKSSLLIGLETSEVSIEPDFVQGVVTYRATVEKERAVLGITPRALSPTATVKVNDLPASSFPALIPLVFGENNVLISVVDDDAESTYNLIVTRSGGLLSGLSINSGNTTIELPQQFEPNVFNYTVTAKNSDTAIRFLPSAVIPGSTITINNIAVVSGQLSEQFELLEGLNEFEIVVNSNGSALTYYISITRPISLLLISALIAYSGRSLSGTVLVPMNSTDLVYDKAIPSASTSVRITPTSASNNVNVTINNIPVVSGGQSGSITLGSGVTPVYISVATLDGQQVRNYTLNISKS